MPCGMQLTCAHYAFDKFSMKQRGAAARETGELEEILAPAPSGRQNRQCSDYLSGTGPEQGSNHHN